MQVISIDLGASSGRCFIAELTKDKKFHIKEACRFENNIVDIDGHLCWDLDKLWVHIYQGLKDCFKQYDDIKSIGIDSWAVDFVCLDKNDCEIRPFISYRDPRTRGALDGFCSKYALKPEDIFKITAAQLLEINTLYQLFAMKEKTPDILKKTHHILMIPDWFHFKLTGKKAAEFTNASTTQMLNAKTKTWSPKIYEKLDLKEHQLPQILEAGDRLGVLKEELQQSLGAKQNIAITLPATHDTASAVAAIPTEDQNPYFISLGTWAVVGKETDTFDVDLKNIKFRIGHEGGIFNTYRKTKNVTGLWLIQKVKKELFPDKTYADIVCEALKYPAAQSLIDPNDDRFLNPPSMHKAIKEFCRQTNQPVPASAGAFARCIFESLACGLADALCDIAQDVPLQKVHIIGGGGQNHFLCQSLSNILNIKVIVGPYEAAVMGNALVQFIGMGQIADIAEARQIIKQNTSPMIFKPQKDQQMLHKNYRQMMHKGDYRAQTKSD